MFGYTRCIICGQLFKRRQPSQKVCRTWTTKYSRDACHRYWNNLYYSKKYWRNKEVQEKYRHKIHTKPHTPNSKAEFTTPAGCIITPTKSGRCSHYVECQHQRDCLMAVPLGWNGFKALDDCGFKRAERGIDTSSQQAEYWGYHQALMIWD